MGILKLQSCLFYLDYMCMCKRKYPCTLQTLYYYSVWTPACRQTRTDGNPRSGDGSQNLCQTMSIGIKATPEAVICVKIKYLSKNLSISEEVYRYQQFSCPNVDYFLSFFMNEGTRTLMTIICSHLSHTFTGRHSHIGSHAHSIFLLNLFIH